MISPCRLKDLLGRKLFIPASTADGKVFYGSDEISIADFGQNVNN
jgi:hypothetical protein